MRFLVLSKKTTTTSDWRQEDMRQENGQTVTTPDWRQDFRQDLRQENGPVQGNTRFEQGRFASLSPCPGFNQPMPFPYDASWKQLEATRRNAAIDQARMSMGSMLPIANMFPADNVSTSEITSDAFLSPLMEPSPSPPISTSASLSPLMAPSATTSLSPLMGPAMSPLPVPTQEAHAYGSPMSLGDPRTIAPPVNDDPRSNQTRPSPRTMYNRSVVEAVLNAFKEERRRAMDELVTHILLVLDNMLLVMSGDTSDEQQSFETRTPDTTHYHHVIQNILNEQLGAANTQRLMKQIAATQTSRMQAERRMAATATKPGHTDINGFSIENAGLSGRRVMKRRFADSESFDDSPGGYYNFGPPAKMRRISEQIFSTSEEGRDVVESLDSDGPGEPAQQGARAPAANLAAPQAAPEAKRAFAAAPFMRQMFAQWSTGPRPARRRESRPFVVTTAPDLPEFPDLGQGS